MQGSKDLQTNETSAQSIKMNQALKNLSAEQESINKIFLSEGGQNKIKYKIATWVMVKYKGFDKKHVCADMSLLYFKNHDPGGFRKV